MKINKDIETELFLPAKQEECNNCHKFFPLSSSECHLSTSQMWSLLFYPLNLGRSVICIGEHENWHNRGMRSKWALELTCLAF
jgi:hypothetical protein